MDAVEYIRENGFDEALDMAYEYHDNEQYSEAIAYYRALIDYAGTNPYIADKETVTDIMEQLVACLRIVGDFPGAIALYDRLIEREGICAEYLLGKAEFYVSLSQCEKAAELRHKALEMIAAEYGCESLKYANALRGIAKSLSDEARYDEAEKAYSEALRIYREKQVAAFDMAILLQDIGRMFSIRRNHGKSLNYYEDALALIEKDFPEDSVDILSLKNDIAGALDGMGNTRAAQKVYEELLLDCYEKFGEDSYNTYVCEGNLAGLYRSAKDFEKGLQLRKRALNGFFRLGGEESRDYQRELVNYAVDLSEQRQYVQAIEALEKAYAIRRKYLGEHNISTVDTLRLIGVQYIKSGNISKAAELFERAVTECEESEQDVTFECVSRISLAKCCILMLETEKAEQLVENILARAENADIESSYIPAYVNLLKAQIDLERNALNEAEENARLAVSLAEQDLTCGEGDINAVRFEYAEILRECKQPEKAEMQFMRILNSVHNDEYHSEKALQILCRLAEIKAEQGDSEQAKFFAERAWEHQSANQSIKAELALHYMSAFVAKFNGDLSRYEAELGTAKRLLISFTGNRKLAGMISLL